MRVSFRYDESDGFITDVPDMKQMTLKNSISNNSSHFSPTEHLLLAMGGCSSDDVVNHRLRLRLM